MIPSVQLRSGQSMQAIGYGTWQITRADTFQQAYDLGYRHFDSATMYGNEKTLGKVLGKCPRESLFLTSKLLPDSEMGTEATPAACNRMLERWGLEYLDLLLIHWPGTNRRQLTETWRAMELLVDSGKVRSIGVSNFLEPHLSHIFSTSSIPPSVNQVEYHPLCQNSALLQYCADHQIIVEGYSPFGAGHSGVLQNHTLQAIGQKYGKTSPQVILRWMYQLSVVPLPRSKDGNRMRENMSIFDFQLDQAEMDQIAGLNEDLHTDWDPRSTL